MKVTSVNASVRYSKPLGDGSFKTVELGAEAAIVGQEKWTEAQSYLYQELGQQLKTLWMTKNNGESQASNNGSSNSRKAAEKTTQAPHCQEHDILFQRFEKNGKSWYSHKTPDGKWCNLK